MPKETETWDRERELVWYRLRQAESKLAEMEKRPSNISRLSWKAITQLGAAIGGLAVIVAKLLTMLESTRGGGP